MNSKNGKTTDIHRLLLNLTDKIDFRRKDKYIALSNLSIYQTWKNIKKCYKNNKFKISDSTWNQHGMKNVNYLMDQILQQTFQIIPNIYSKA